MKASGIQYLLESGKVQRADVERAGRNAEEQNTALGTALVRLGLLAERDWAEVVSRTHSLPLVSDVELAQDRLMLEGVSPKFLKESLALPLRVDDKVIHVAAVNPDDSSLREMLELATGRAVAFSVATVSQLERALESHYGDGRSAMESVVDAIADSGKAADDESAERLRDMAAEAPIVRLVNMILNRAVQLRASDVHIEPFENQLKVRYRIDGVMQETESPPTHSAAAIISRLKLMARLNIAERRLPQDGRFQLRSHGKVIDTRVSTVPMMHGESLVLRLLDQQQVVSDFASLGLSENVRGALEQALKMSRGIVLVTGPTGSGKTTTLYTALNGLNTPEKKILTVEDPIEYQLVGVNQMQVKPQISLTFANALRSLLRQDPDILMIGEMRDLETARIAVQAALTGHLVLSTLHTNDAGSSITRLLDMGVEEFLLTSTLNCILAQRLVRTLCAACRQPKANSREFIQKLPFALAGADDAVALYEAVGCERCGGSGYFGRTVIAECLMVSAEIRHAILARADGVALQQLAVSSGMRTLQDDGFRKALAGITTIEEVTRVTQT